MEKGKSTLFRIVKYDEEKGQLVDGDSVLMKKALQGFYSTNPLVIISAIGQPKSGKTTILNSFIDYFVKKRNNREPTKTADPVSMFPNLSGSQQSDGIHAVCLPFRTHSKFGRPLGVILLDIKYDGNNPAFYDSCVNFCLKVSSLALFTYRPETLEGTVWNEAASISARKGSHKLQGAAAVFTGLGAPDVGYVFDDVKEYFANYGVENANEGKPHATETVSKIYDISSKMCVAVLPVMPKLYSANSGSQGSDCKEKLFDLLFGPLEPLKIDAGTIEYCNHFCILQVFQNALGIATSSKDAMIVAEQSGCVVYANCRKPEVNSNSAKDHSFSITIEDRRKPEESKAKSDTITAVATEKVSSRSKSVYPDLSREQKVQTEERRDKNVGSEVNASREQPSCSRSDTVIAVDAEKVSCRSKSMYPYLTREQQVQTSERCDKFIGSEVNAGGEQPSCSRSDTITVVATEKVSSGSQSMYPDVKREQQVQTEERREKHIGWKLSASGEQPSCSRYCRAYPNAQATFIGGFDINANASKDVINEIQEEVTEGTSEPLLLQKLLSKLKDISVVTPKMAKTELRKQFSIVVMHLACSFISPSKISEYEAANNEWLQKMAQINERLHSDSQPSFNDELNRLCSDLYNGKDNFTKIKEKLIELSKSTLCLEENDFQSSIDRIKKENRFTACSDPGKEALANLLNTSIEAVCSTMLRRNKENIQLEICVVKQAGCHAFRRYTSVMSGLLSTSVFNDSDFNSLHAKISELILSGFRYQNSYNYTYMWDTACESLKGVMNAESENYRRKNQRKLLQIRKEIGSALKACMKLYDENCLRGTNLSSADVREKHILAKTLSLQKMNEIVAANQATSGYIREAVQNAICNRIKRFAQQRGLDVNLLGDKKKVVLYFRPSEIILGWDDSGIRTLCVEPELCIIEGRPRIKVANSGTSVSSRSSYVGERWNILDLMKNGANWETLEKFKGFGRNCTHAEHILALYFELLKDLLMQQRQIFMAECVVVVREDTSFLEKHRLKTALHLSGLQNNFLMCSTGALAVSYLQGIMNIQPLDGEHELIIIMGSSESFEFGAFKVGKNSVSMTRILNTDLKKGDELKAMRAEIDDQEWKNSASKRFLLIHETSASCSLINVEAELQNRGITFSSINLSDFTPVLQGALAIMDSRSGTPKDQHIHYAEVSPYTLVLDAVFNKATMVSHNQLLTRSITTTKELWYLEPQKIKIMDYSASLRFPIPRQLVAFHCKVPQYQVKGNVMFSVTISPEGIVSNVEAKSEMNGENIPFESRSDLIPFESEELAAAVIEARQRHQVSLTQYSVEESVIDSAADTVNDDNDMEWADAQETQAENGNKAAANPLKEEQGRLSLKQLDNLIATLEEKLVSAPAPMVQHGRKRINTVRAAIDSGNISEKEIAAHMRSLTLVTDQLSR